MKKEEKVKSDLIEDKVRELLLFCEKDGSVCNGFRTKDIILTLKNLTDNLNEEWRTFEHDTRFEVSTLGRVKKLGIIIEPRISKGYPYVSVLYDGKHKTYKIHRMVAETYIDNPDNKPQVNHIDGNKTNNSLVNLEWTTCSENIKHAFDRGLMKPTQSSKGKYYGDHGTAKVILKICPNTNKVLEEFDSLTRAVHSLGAKGLSHMSQCANGKKDTYRGFKWRYKYDIDANYNRLF